MPEAFKVKHTRLVEKQKRLYGRLITTYQMIAGLPKNIQVFKTRSIALPELFQEFNAVLDELELIQAEEPALVSDTSKSASDFEDKYFGILAVYNDLKAKEEAATPRASLNDSGTPAIVEYKNKLPELSIPKFDGTIGNFSSFHAMFDALVHQASISDIEKFSYLVSYLEGSALQLVRSVDFQGENYQTAYELLIERYTNKRVIAQFYLNKLLNLTPSKSDSTTNRQLTDTIRSTVAGIKSLNIPDLADFILLHLGLRLLDKKTRKAFEDQHLANDFPTFHDFTAFLRNQGAVSDLLSEAVTSNPPNVVSKERKSGAKVLLAQQSEVAQSNSTPSSSDKAKAPLSCPCCLSTHKLSKCERFLAMSVPERKSLIEEKRLCYACFARHRIESCKSVFKCRVCKRSSHNTLIHPEVTEAQPTSNSASPTHAPQPSIALANVCPKPTSNLIALLGTARATIFDVMGRPHSCRVVFDTGSQANLICSSLASRLGLPRKKGSFDLSGVGQSTVHTMVQGSISCKLSSIHNPESFMHLEAAIIPQITSDLPTSPLSEQLSAKFKFLTLADPEFMKPAPVDILLGVQAVLDASLDSTGPIKGFPCAVPTLFGYVIMGSVPVEPSPVVLTSLLASVPPEVPLQKLEGAIQAFWEQEEVEVPRPSSKDDLACEQHFNETISRDETGRYIARLPFVGGLTPTLGSTRNRALKRLFRLESQFQQNPQFCQLYKACLRDYVDKGHMIRAEKPGEYLLTHHGVPKGTGPDMKIRVVFNPSEKDPTGLSLNSCLLKGPKKQGDIGELLTRFRTHRVAVKCDVKTMFRAIRLHHQDQDFLHFFWRFNPSDPVVEWQLTTVTFGVTSSPFTAQATLEQLVRDEGHKFPLAARALKYETYIDDIISGGSTEAEANELCNQLVSLMRTGGFELGKWASSSSTLFSNNPGIVDLPFDENPSDGKVLGIGWDPSLDAFRCHVDPTPYSATKRGVMSKLARLYDPNGYFAPTTFALKTIVQQLWLLKLPWDAPLPDHLMPTWKSIEDELIILEQIRIPRCLLPERNSALQLIGFSDASELGMCAVLYLRVETPDGVQVNLIKSKTKVAPLKAWTIPRLELGAAHLLGQMIRSVQGFIEYLSISEIICFTDSMTTLAWLRTPPYKLKQFVCNRVVQTHDACPTATWKHVPGKLNPADVGSRGIRPSKLVEHELWWHGSPFLREPPECWPEEPTLNFIGLPETKEAPILCFLSISDPGPIITLIEKSSSLLKLQRVVAYLLRLIHNSRIHSTQSAAPSRRSGPISSAEYKEALDVLIAVTQAHHFREDIKLLSGGKDCSRKIAAMSPFLSPEGFLRVGGRIAWAPISEKAKRPILIPKESHLARLLVDYYHEYTAHGGPRLVQSLIHQYYWISSSRDLIRKRIRKCVSCSRFAAHTSQPRMADLPKSRLSPGRAFTHTGVDFGGPFWIRLSNRRNAAKEKGYFSLFVCMTTRAVHIEVVSSLSTEGCFAAIDRFIARRGLPSHIYSDNGRNFTGCAREMSEIHSFLKASNIDFEEYLAKRQISWIFNPPLAPNFGGAWEALIKRTKFHLKRVIGDRCLNFEEFQTLFTRIEAILNSRPLTALPGSPNDPADCLTPGHFLVGGPLLARPEEDVLEENPALLRKWKMVTQLVQSFWVRWRKEYLHSLQPRTKWTKKTPDLQDGAVVLLKSPNTAPTQWPLGRIEKVMPGSDGTVRVARVKTATGVLTRPTNQLVVLPNLIKIELLYILY